MNHLLRSIVLAGAQYAMAETLLRGTKAKRKLGVILRGVLLLGIAGGLVGFAGIVLLASLFFSLADMPEFIKPAVITALVTIALALALAWEGWRQIQQ